MSDIDERIGIQCPVAIDANYRSNETVTEYMKAAAEFRLSFAELNVVDYNGVSAQGLVEWLDEFGLRLLNLATGATAAQRGHSLAHPEAAVRQDAIDTLKDGMRFASEVGGFTGGAAPGMILGLVQGNSAESKAKQRERFRGALEELLPTAEKQGVCLVIEATNRYLSGVSHTVEESVEFIKQLGSDRLRVLPDTYHMNIEERDMTAELLRYLSYIDELHISDNNRLYPGLGAIGFRHVIDCLEAAGFRGAYVIEGNIESDLTSSLRSAVATVT